MSEALNGILVLDKPAGVSSAGLLNRLKRALPRGTKLGHAGTLDPFATGVLLGLVGKATKRCEEAMGWAKVYRAVVKLGATTETLDPESAEMAMPPAEIPDEAAVRRALRVVSGEDADQDDPATREWESLGGLVGGGPKPLPDAQRGWKVLQVPPVYSAMKVGGKRAYELARKGEAPEMTARRVRVYRMQLLSYAWPVAELEMEVGRGFYVRSLARDLGAELGTGGYLTALRRVRVGAFAVDGPGACGVTVEDVTPENVAGLLKV